MAFRMNRPVIKGTANHKASIAKAKAESVVSQSRTQADAGLVGAGKELGKSYIPAAIDYSIDQKGIEFLDIKKEKGVKPKSDYENYLEDIGATTEDIGEEKGVLSEKDFKQLNKQKTKKEKKVKKEKQPKVKKEKKVKVEKGDNIFEKGYQSIKDKIRIARENIEKNKKQKELDLQAEQEEKNRTKLEADKLKQAELDNKEIANALALERKNEEKLKKRLIREEAAERRKNKSKKAVIEVGEVTTEGIGDQQINQYTKEQRERLNTGEEGGNVWSKQEERYVLPEEIVDGKFVSKAEGEKIQILESDEFSGDNQTSKTVVGENTTKPVVEETKTPTTTEKPKVSDFRTKKNAFGGTLTAKEQYEKALKEYYSKSPATMRDNRIYRNAIKGGVVQQNMIKSGYIPE